MTGEQFIKEFSLIADAPNGVKKLREMILQLAVQGKLVPQNPKDEPASVLLEKIAAEKERLIKEGRIKKSKPFPPVEPDDVPYQLPDGWEWSCLEELGIVNPRNDVPDDLESAFTPMALLSDIYGSYPEYETRLWGEIRKAFSHFAEGDVAVAKITPCFQNGKAGVFRNIPNSVGAGTTELHVFRPIKDTLISQYVWIYCKTPKFLADGELLMTGSAGQKRVPRSYFANKPVPLPPLAEQGRIVAKVDELMRLCDALEAKQKAKAEKRIALNASCLNALLDTKPGKKSAKRAAPAGSAQQRIMDNFDILYDTPQTVAELRKAILQLAVQGRLVPQDPKDEPASVLLQKIVAEKERLIKEGKIKKSKPLPPIDQDDVPYQLPDGWEWVCLREVTRECGQKVPDEPFTYIDVAAIDKERGLISGDIQTLTPEDAPSRARKLVESGSVIYSTVRPYLLNIAVVDRTFAPPPIVSTAFFVMHPLGGISSRFLYHYLRSQPFLDYVNDAMTGVAYPAVNDAKMSVGPLPLPPLAEQKRIVDKVDELMKLCDKLESELAQSESDAETLMDAVVHHLCGGGEAAA